MDDEISLSFWIHKMDDLCISSTVALLIICSPFKVHELTSKASIFSRSTILPCCVPSWRKFVFSLNKRSLHPSKISSVAGSCFRFFDHARHIRCSFCRLIWLIVTRFDSTHLDCSRPKGHQHISMFLSSTFRPALTSSSTSAGEGNFLQVWNCKNQSV